MQELNRKTFNEMRWEEIWDASLRIRNMFLSTSIPGTLDKELRNGIEEVFGEKAVVIRSSSPSEDTSKTSFAGIHESYVNVCGIEQILKHVRLVWASLYSPVATHYNDRA